MPRTLLLVDDSVTIQRVVELTFAHEDVRIVSMSDGQRALQWLDVDKPDIAVIDVGVPEVDGYTVASRMKAMKRNKDVPVLLLAGAFEPVDEKRVREVGCDGVIVKPFEPKQLVDRVKELIDIKPIKAASRSATPVHGAPSVPAAAAAVANPPALRAVRSMPTPAPEPAPRPEPEEPMPTPVAPAASTAATSATKPSPTPASQPAAAPANPIPASPAASMPAAVSFGMPVTAPAAGSGSVAAPPVAVEDPPPPVAGARPAQPQPLELPNRPMWQSSGGPQPVPSPVSVTPQPLSAPQSSAKAALVNAFSALLAVDQPAPLPPPPAPAPTVAVVSETMIEAAVRKVLSQLTEEQVRKVVTETAERMVREEIERIKDHPE